jgi:hypothetical protein
MKTSSLNNFINNCKKAVYANAAINAKSELGPKRFYSEALEVIRYYKSNNSHNVPTIQAYCNLMGYSTY